MIASGRAMERQFEALAHDPAMKYRHFRRKSFNTATGKRAVYASKMTSRKAGA